MKIALLADIHANYWALNAAIDHLSSWRPDRVIIAGDIVNRGPRPAECLELIQHRVESEKWLVLRGNHEDYVILHANPDAPHQGPALEVHRASRWTYQQLGENVTALVVMPLKQVFPGPDGRSVQFVHGSLMGTRDGVYPETSDYSLRKKVGLDHLSPGDNSLALFGVGHTHRPVIRWLNDVLVVNAGSVGLPFDHDTRLTYAQLTWQNGNWRAEIVRLDYDLDRAERDFYDTGYLENAGPLTQLVMIELLTASSHLYNWAIEFQESALKGTISVAESVQKYLSRLQTNWR
jgi:predicted phosphodiesterase